MRACDIQHLTPTSNIIEQYGNLVYKGEDGLLALTLARDAVFGQEVMAQCIPLGTKNKKALPQKDLSLIKQAIFQLHHDMWLELEKFEPTWKTCHISIQQGCGRKCRDAKKKELCVGNTYVHSSVL